MLIDVGEGRWLSSDKIVLVTVASHLVQVTLDGGWKVDLVGHDREQFLRLMNAFSVCEKPFPEVL